MVISYTISTVNYLPFAKSLGDSFVRNNPGKEFVVVLTDELPESFEFPYPIITVQELNIPSFDEMNSRYNIFELSCALKPFAASYFLKNISGCSAVIYFDCDILVYAELDMAETLLQKHSVLLTPHISFTKDHDTKETVELMVLAAGIFNAGFFGVSNSEEGLIFLDWWQKRMEKYSYADIPNSLFVDQLWLNFVPIYFKNAFILHDPGYNMAYWNLGERNLSMNGSKHWVNEKYPLVFYHFSGFDINQPELLSKHLAAFTFENRPEMQNLFEEFRNSVLENNENDLLSLAPKYGKPKEIILPPEPEPEPEPPKREKFFKRKYNKLFGKKN